MGSQSDRSVSSARSEHEDEEEDDAASTSSVPSPVSVAELMGADFDVDGQRISTAITMRYRRKELGRNHGLGKRKTAIQITDDEAAFVLGRGGRTKQKISRVSGCKVNLTPSLVLELIGTAEERDRAELYMKLVIQQRRGRVVVDFDEEYRDDLSIIDVPVNSVAFVTGQGGHVLRAIEEEWGTLMFFVGIYNGPSKTKAEGLGDPRRMADPDLVPSDTPNENDYSVPPRVGDPASTTIAEEDRVTVPRLSELNETRERLLIFGPLRGRRGAQLKVMSAVEQKNPRRFCSYFSGTYESPNPNFGTDRMVIGADDFSYALGKDGSTRRKLARAAHCILEYIGRIAFIAGTAEERRRCREYLTWLIEQRTKPLHVNTAGRRDVTTVSVPANIIRSIAGPRGVRLRQMEQETQTFCFIDSVSDRPDRERLLIFSHSSQCRERARLMLYNQMDDYLSRQEQQRRDFVYEGPRQPAYCRPPSGEYRQESFYHHSQHMQPPPRGSHHEAPDDPPSCYGSNSNIPEGLDHYIDRGKRRRLASPPPHQQQQNRRRSTTAATIDRFGR